MRRATTVMTVVLLALTLVSAAQAESEWFVIGEDLGIENAERIIVAQQLQFHPDLDVGGSTDTSDRFPPGIYYPFKVWDHPAGGGKPTSAVGYFKFLVGEHGMYDLTLPPVMFRIAEAIPPDAPPWFIPLSWDAYGYTSIGAGIYRAGEALPSLRALAVEIRVNPNTVQRAYVELEREGVVQSRRGLGVFVIDPKGKAARGKIERNIVSGLRECISTGLDAEVSPARIRELFESALDSSLTKARSGQ